MSRLITSPKTALAASVLALAVLGGCGSNPKATLGEGDFITVTDAETGRDFRCLYVDGEYAADMLCYEPIEGEMP